MATEKLHGDVKSGIETILHKGSGLLEKAKEEFRGHSEPSPSKDLEQGSEEQGKKGMDALSAVMDKVKSNPEMVEKVKEEAISLAEALHLRKPEPKAEGEAAKHVDESTSTNKTEGISVAQEAVEEIQAAIAEVQHQQAAAVTETPAQAAETSAEGEKPQETKREAEKDDPSKRIDFFGFFAMLFERCCSPANKKD